MLKNATHGLSATWVARTLVFPAILISFLATIATEAQAVPSYARRYGVPCALCHTMWGSLNGAGVTFRLSGYRAINGSDLKPLTDDIQLSQGGFLPANLPISVISGVGIDSRSEARKQTGSSGVNTSGSALAVEDLSVFLSTPLGPHLSTFIEFPMFETRAWEFTPTGNFEAHNTGRLSNGLPAAGRQTEFVAESPIFEVAKFWWNSLLGEGVQRDSLNALAGITQLPLAYASGKVRLSVNQYIVYERSALDLISPKSTSKGPNNIFGGNDPNDVLFRMSEAQGLAEINGMLLFGTPVEQVSEAKTFWAEYHLGVTNGSNAHARTDSSGGDPYLRAVVRWYRQSLGVWAFSSSNIYSDQLRTMASQAGNSNGIMSGLQVPNSSTRYGADTTLSLAVFDIPVWLDNQVMWNSESNPTGFGVRFDWQGGFDQLNWQISKTSIAYGRYDWIQGTKFNDTGRTVNGVQGMTLSRPEEQDYVVGYQHQIEQNIKLILEYRNHEFDDTASGSRLKQNTAKLTDTGGTVRMMFGF